MVESEEQASQDHEPAAWSQFWDAPAHFRPLYAAVDEFTGGSAEHNFVKDVKWSPDGLCLLASADDNAIRLFEPGGAEADAAKLQESWCVLLPQSPPPARLLAAAAFLLPPGGSAHHKLLAMAQVLAGT